jgi:hypothetical protein
MKLTLSRLKDGGACQKDINKFEFLFGQEGEVTLDKCIIAEEHGFNLDWAARNLLSGVALEAYHVAMRPAWEGYEKARAAARAEGNLTNYQKVKAEAKVIVNRAKAHAFFEASKIIEGDQ